MLTTAFIMLGGQAAARIYTLIVAPQPTTGRVADLLILVPLGIGMWGLWPLITGET